MTKLNSCLPSLMSKIWIYKFCQTWNMLQTTVVYMTTSGAIRALTFTSFETRQRLEGKIINEYWQPSVMWSILHKQFYSCIEKRVSRWFTGQIFCYRPILRFLVQHDSSCDTSNHGFDSQGKCIINLIAWLYQKTQWLLQGLHFKVTFKTWFDR